MYKGSFGSLVTLHINGWTPWCLDVDTKEKNRLHHLQGSEKNTLVPRDVELFSPKGGGT